MSTRIEGIIDRLTDAETFDSIKWILGEAVAENYAQAVIDAHIKANFEFQSKSGLPTSTTRTITERKACKWCKERQGRYTYGNTPSGFWDRHENCKCIITYIPVDGSTVQTLQGTGKKWEIVDEQVLKERKKINLDVWSASKKVLEARKIIGLNTERQAVETGAAAGTNIDGLTQAQ